MVYHWLLGIYKNKYDYFWKLKHSTERIYLGKVDHDQGNKIKILKQNTRWEALTFVGICVVHGNGYKLNVM